MFTLKINPHFAPYDEAVLFVPERQWRLRTSRKEMVEGTFVHTQAN
jgi:hypothetical protein